MTVDTIAPPSIPRNTTLGGEAIGELSRLIAGAFDRTELEFLLRVKLNFDLAGELDTAVPYITLVFRLILALERRGSIVDFLRAVREARPKRDDLRAAIDIQCPRAKETPDLAAAATAAAAGLGAVKDKLDDPMVRNLVAPHREELAQLMEGIGVLANYKILHNSLQTIQLTHLVQMISDMQRLKTDELAGQTLEVHLFQLRDLCEEGLEAANGLPDVAAVRAAELDWLDKFKALLDRIEHAVDSLDDREGGRALRSLRLLIRPASSRINAFLSATADRLPLERLITIVEQVVSATALDGGTISEMRRGLQSLQSMLPQLKGRIVEHNKWQEIEQEFIDTDIFTDQGTPDSIDNFRDAWPDMKKKVAALADTAPAADWAQKSQTLSTAIDGNLAADMDRARRNFSSFRRTVQFQFFEVDRSLRKHCVSVLAIRAPLKSLLSEVS